MFTSIGAQTKIDFFSDLDLLLHHGVSVAEALTTIHDGCDDRRLNTLLHRIQERVSSGVVFSEACRAEGQVFSTLECALLHVGESTGTLREVAGTLASWLRKREALRTRVHTVLLYPKLLVGATLAVMIGIAVLVFPRLIPLFSGINVPMPLPTRILLGTVDLFKTQWLLIVCAILCCAGLSYVLGRIAWIRLQKER